MSQDNVGRILELQAMRAQHHVDASEIRLKNARVKAEIVELLSRIDDPVELARFAPGPVCW